MDVRIREASIGSWQQQWAHLARPLWLDDRVDGRRWQRLAFFAVCGASAWGLFAVLGIGLWRMF